MNWSSRQVFPFSAIVGQKQLKRALLANAVQPSVGGVLVRGHKGAAKSTAVRALASIMPQADVIAGCPFGCDPNGLQCSWCVARNGSAQVESRQVRMVDLPVGVTEDRVVGALDFEHAMRTGDVRLDPGLLGRANRGVLYIDEVNLLDAGVVALVLDAASSGWNRVEREGVSFVHPSRFVLVGSMNPEEGLPGPQLVDRFGLCVDVVGLVDVEQRVTLMRRLLQFETDPIGFAEQWEPAQTALRKRIERARLAVSSIEISSSLLRRIGCMARDACAAGHRAELTIRHAALALAALDQAGSVDSTHVDEAAEMALAHRMRPAPPHKSPPPAQDDMRPQRDKDQAASPQPTDQPPPKHNPEEVDPGEPPPQQGNGGPASEKMFGIGESYSVRRIEPSKDRLARSSAGRRAKTRTQSRAGRYVSSRLPRGTGDIAFDATLRAAAPHQSNRAGSGLALALRREDLREKARERKTSTLIILAVDASGSMGAMRRMEEAKGAVLSLLQDAYLKRDKVGLIAFRGEGAEELLPPTRSIDLARRFLSELPTGGRTPLAAGLAQAYEVAQRQLLRDPCSIPMLVIVTDGRANASQDDKDPLAEASRLAFGIGMDARLHPVVVDVEQDGMVNLGLARRLACQMNAQYYKMADLRGDQLADCIRRQDMAIRADIDR
ncbi:magnesium chelatase subunit D family protein [Salidesulfovibrio brasiliensis]|uniref:magnesium chelatase subunit D family protein n=1 Tax=Salidesulfovibrio brasiliensis TaxID=221711 RepID=UPI0006D0BEEF|nr:magnesium chelatase subunit D family protein [Salidesulfovibrio brasiliensis]